MTKFIPRRVSFLIDKSLVGYHFLCDRIPRRVDSEKPSGTSPSARKASAGFHMEDFIMDLGLEFPIYGETLVKRKDY